MPDLADLFPGFASRYIPTQAGRIFTRIGGAGPPMVLLHGFPQTGVMWHRLAPTLAQHFTLVIPDLRGYGWSSAPASQGGERYAKRVMGADVVAVMEELGHVRFALIGHDRGARVGYRLALDHPGRIERLAVLDVAPTLCVWQSIEAGSSFSPHWPYLARPEPGPEQDIASNPDDYFVGLMRHWTRDGTLDCFDPRALAHYRAGWGDPSRIHAMCEDYRAGALQDRAADEEDLANAHTIACPFHLVAGTDYLGRSGAETPLKAWRRTFAPAAEATTVTSGHFVAEENPAETTDALMAFLAP